MWDAKPYLHWPISKIWQQVLTSSATTTNKKSFLVEQAMASFFDVLIGCTETGSSRAFQHSKRFWGILMQGLHADGRHRLVKKNIKRSLRPVPWPSEPAHPHYWLSSSCQSHWGWWEAVESSSTRSPWSPQSLSSNRCGRRLSAACAWGSCGNAPWPSQARRCDEPQLVFFFFFWSVINVNLCFLLGEKYYTLEIENANTCKMYYCTTKRKLVKGSEFGTSLKHTQVTSLVEGELSEPDEVVLDSSSADIDFPFSLWKRAKYGKGYGLPIFFLH